MSRLLTLLHPQPSSQIIVPETDIGFEYIMDPSQGTFFDTAAVSTDNQAVDEVRNLRGSENTRHFLQAAAGSAACPILRLAANGIDGRAALQFDGLAKFLRADMASSYAGTAMSFLSVVKRSSFVDQARVAVASKSAASTNDFDNSGSVIFEFDDTLNTNITAYRNGGSATRNHPGNGSVYVISVVLDGTNCKVYVNGGTPGSFASSAAFATDILLLGSGIMSGVEQYFFAGLMGEAFWKLGAIGSAQHNQMGAYFASRYPSVTWNTVS